MRKKIPSEMAIMLPGLLIPTMIPGSGIVVNINLIVPQRVNQIGPRDDLTGMSYQTGQNLQFVAGQLCSFAGGR